MIGARVTDAVVFFQRRGELRRAVRTVRDRDPERFRWRAAVGRLTSSAGRMRGLDRMRVEEPIREVVLDTTDRFLRREVVLDARRANVDLDRGEVLPRHRMGDLRRMAFLTGADVRVIERFVALPVDFEAPIDTAGVVLVGRALADQHRRRAQRLWLELPDPDGPDTFRLHHQYMAQRADRDADLAHRWTALTRAILGEQR